MTNELILYACPGGILAQQLECYFALARQAGHVNTAHAYMPHCSLTGFFHDTAAGIPVYQQAMTTALAAMPPDREAIRISGLLCNRDFHGLTIDSPWLLRLTEVFVSLAPSSTRSDALRRKTWLHLSLAYEFPAAEHDALLQLASRCVKVEAPATWSIRFYERSADKVWITHGDWPLPEYPT